MQSTFNYDLFSVDETIEKKMKSLQNFSILFEQTKNSNTFAELNALMQLLETSLFVFEEHLIIDLFSHCEDLCYHLHANEQLTQLYFLLGMTYFKQNEYKIASTHFIQSAKIGASSSMPYHTCIAFCYTAHCFLQMADYEKALNYTKTAFWLRNKHQITDIFILNHIYHQFCLIYKTLKLPYVNYYMRFLDEFLETDGYEQGKGKIHLLKASIQADTKNYNKEYEHLKFALDCYLKTCDLNKQILVLNAILNCPASIKTSSEQTEYIRQLKKIELTFNSAYSGFSFKKTLLKFDLNHTKFPILNYDLSDSDFQKSCEDTLQDQPFLLIISLKEHSKYTTASIKDKYKHIEKILFNEIEKDAIISTFLQNQIIFLIQKSAINDSSFFFDNLTELIQDQVDAISFGYTQADQDTLSCRKLYNQTYVNFYYNHTK